MASASIHVQCVLADAERFISCSKCCALSHSPPMVSTVCVVPLPSTLSSFIPGVRRAAGGVHVDEEVCTGPQADTHTSSAAAYRQPSATVTDTVLAASQAMSGTGEDGTTAHRADSSGGIVQSPRRVAAGGVPVNRPLPSAVLDQLPTLSHQPRRLPVIVDGRCSVASVLLARGVIPDAHITEQGRKTIDAARRQLGRAMVGKWSEADCVRRVPIQVRDAHMPFNQTDPAGTQSYCTPDPDRGSPVPRLLSQRGRRVRHSLVLMLWSSVCGAKATSLLASIGAIDRC